MDTLPATQTLRALDGVNLLVAAVLAGFGPFVAVFLGARGWSQQGIGFVLSAAGIAGLLSQIPGGELLDVTRSKRLLVGAGTLMLAGGALIIAIRPDFLLVFAALALQGATAGFLGPGIVAISLGIVGRSGLAERLGRNQRFKSTGSLLAAAVMGAIGYFLSDRMIFFAAAALALPTLLALMRIHAADIHFGRSVGAPDHHEPTTPRRAARRSFWKNRPLLAFAGCLFLFQAADASMLPLIGGTLAHSEGNRSSLIMSALIVVPQIIVALLAPWTGRRAESWGRRPLLLIGIGVLPIRAVLFTLIADPAFLIAVQTLDGISGTVLGVLTALIVADLTHGTGRFNLAQGLVGTIAGIGAALSTTLTGLVAGSFGRSAGFLLVVAMASAAVAIAWSFVPETKPSGSNSAATGQWSGPQE
jgi:MFS family permease